MIKSSILQSADQRASVLLIAPWFAPGYRGGAPRLFDGLLSNTKQYDFSVLTSYDNTTVEEASSYDQLTWQQKGYRIHREKTPPLEFPSSASLAKKGWAALRFLHSKRRGLKEVLSEIRPKAVVVGDTYSCGWLCNGLPDDLLRINYIHGEELAMNQEYGPLSRWLRKNQLRSLRTADVNIAVSQWSADEVIRVSNAPDSTLRVLPNAVETARFTPPVDRNAVRAALGWSGRKVALTVARLVPRKGIDQVLLALKRSAQLPEEWLYVIAGRGQLEAALKDQVVELGLQEHVQFLGFVPDEQLPDLYGAADLFVQPNRSIDGDTEGFGIVFLEASACGTPVIGGIAGGTADAIEEGVSGFRVNGDDVGEIMRALEALFNDDILRQRMACAGLERARRDFTVQSLARRFEDVVTEALARKPSSR